MKTQFEAYRQLMEQGEFLKVIDTFFHEDMVQLEPSGKKIKGKETLRAEEEKNLAGVNTVHIQIPNFAINEETGVVMGEMFIRMDSKKFGKKKLEEAFIQKWVEGKIVYQRFYYSGFEDDTA